MVAVVEIQGRLGLSPRPRTDFRPVSALSPNESPQHPLHVMHHERQSIRYKISAALGAHRSITSDELVVLGSGEVNEKAARGRQ